MNQKNELLISTACAEHGEGGAEGDKTHGRKTGADVDHVGLSDTTVIETIGDLYYIRDWLD